MEKICKILYNFEELSLLNKKTFNSVFVFWYSGRIEIEINTGFYVKMKSRGAITRQSMEI